MCQRPLSSPLHKLFNASLRSGVMLVIWKRSFLFSIFESGDKHDIKYYRPTLKLSIIPKHFERILCDMITLNIKPTLIG